MKFTFLLSLAIVSFHAFLNSILIKISYFLNMACVASAPQSEWRFAYQAIVCGSPLRGGQFKSDLITTGLIHLIVVSGSHLIFLSQLLEMLLKKFPRYKLVIGITLLLFTLTTNLQPPTVRALVSLNLGQLAQTRRLFWTRAQLVLMSGLLTLLFFPSWVSSISFIMSWAASFALATNKYPANELRHHTWVFLVLFPIFLPLSPLNPISIAANLIFAPLVGMLLFPLSLLGFLHPLFTILSDGLWYGLDFALKTLANSAPQLLLPQPYASYWLWVYLFTAHILSQVHWVTKRRNFDG